MQHANKVFIQFNSSFTGMKKHQIQNILKIGDIETSPGTPGVLEGVPRVTQLNDR